MANAAGYPNRMAPNTAAALSWLAWPCCSWARGLGAASWPASCAALATAIIALLAIIGYAYSSLSLAGIERFIPMALNTALALALISGGILAARPDRGVMAIVTSGDAGGVMARRLLPAVILIPALVGWLVWLGRHEGMLDRVMALSLFVLTNIVILTALDLVERGFAQPDGPRPAAGGAAPGNPVHGDARPGGIARTRRRRAQDLASDLRWIGLDGGCRVVGRPGGECIALQRRVALAVVLGG